MSTYAARLAKMDEAYGEAEAKTGGALAPDGDYTLRIERFEFWAKDGVGPLKLITELSVADGEYQGTPAPSVWHELEDPDRIGWTKGYLHMLGLEGIKLSDLEKALEPIAGTTLVDGRVVTTSKNGKTYRNTYINGLVGEPGSAPEATSDTGDEDDIPF